MKILRVTLILILLAAVPAVRYVVDFRAGAHCAPCGFMGNPSWFVFFPGSLIVAIIAGILLPARSHSRRIAVAVIVFFLAPVLAITVAPTGVVAYARGFEQSIQKKPGIAELQRWAENTLRDFRNGTLCATGHPSYFYQGDLLISTNDLPQFLTTGVFSRRERGHLVGPEVSICRKYSWTRSSEECIVISWYLHGLLIGAPSFTNNCNAGYSKQLAPRVYSFFVVN